MITFAIPTWNRVDKLKVCLESMIQQINEIEETVRICVYNNASDDGTNELLEEFKDKYPDVIEYQNGKEHVRGQESFKRAFLMPKTEWMWMFGDDDLLAENGLKNILDILKRKDVDFIHAAEFTRVSGEPKTYYATTMELCCGFGFVEMTGFISGNICRTKKLQGVLNGDDCKMYQECSYFQSLVILDAFSDSKAAFINAPVVDLQERVQAIATCERWDKEEVPIHYADLGDGLTRLKEKGIIQGLLPDDFFRYLSVNLFTKILYTFYGMSSTKKELVDDKYWDMVLKLAGLASDTAMAGKIVKFRESLQVYVDHIKLTDPLLLKVQEMHDLCTNTLYPDTYI